MISHLTPFVRASLLLAATALSATVAAQGQPDGRSTAALDEDVVAVVAGEQITRDDFEREMAVRGGDIPGQYATAEQRRALLDELIGYRALVAKARELGYDRDPAVVAATERAMVAKLQQQELDQRLDEVSVSAEQVAAYYGAHRAEYGRPERYKAAIVFIEVHQNATVERRAELRARADRALAEAERLEPSKADFGAVAQKYSDDRASRYRGGIIGWLTKHPSRQYKWDPEVVKAIFSLAEPGQIGPVVETDDGFYLVRLVEREAGRERPLDQVEDGIRNRLMREERERLRRDFLRKAVAGAEVQVNVELLESIEPPTPAGTGAQEDGPPALPAG